VALKYMSIKEFVEFGYLQEVNRQFFHPLGLALDAHVDPDSGVARLGRIWITDDPEGFIFGSAINLDKSRRVEKRRLQKARARMKKFGFVIQPVERED